MSMRELLIEVEVAMTAVLEYSPIIGWQAPDKVGLTPPCLTPVRITVFPDPFTPPVASTLLIRSD